MLPRYIERLKKKRKSPLISLLKGSLYLFAFGLLFATIGIAAIYYYYSKDLPDIRELKNYKPSLITRVFSDSDELIEEFFIERRILLPLSKIPEILKKATIAVEDSNFFEHRGVDISGIVRASYNNLKAGKIVEGGSTITQQVAKTMFLTPEKKFERKIKEAILAIRIERHFSKEEILEIYLNQIYYGHGAYGVEAASLTHFNKHVENITLPEAAFLAGLPRAPSRYSLTKNLGKAWKRRAYALNRMAEEGFISLNEAKKGINSEFKLSNKKKEVTHEAQHFVEYIRQYIQKQYGTANLYRNGLNIYTTLNLKDQKYAHQAILKGLREADKRYGYRGPIGKIEIGNGLEDGAIEIRQLNLQNSEDSEEGIYQPGKILKGVVAKINDKTVDIDLGIGWGKIDLKNMSWARKPDPKIDGKYARIKDPNDALDVGDIIEVKILLKDKTQNQDSLTLALEQEPLVQGALISIDVATGHIKSMIGGRDFLKSEFNRALQSSRQPGSAFKPIIYSAAIEEGYTPSSIFIDSPIIYNDENLIKNKWKPINFEQKFYGPTTLRNAITHSRNIVTIKILQKIGIQKIVNYVRRIGIKSPINKDLSLALGSSGNTLLELTSAYSTFARGGVKIIPIAIRYITDRNGTILEENHPSSERVISEEVSYIITNLLKNVVNHGTGRKVRALGRPVAGKTGTTNNFIDAWFLGYVPERVTGVWVGMDDYSPLGKNETGSRTASPIWLDYMKSALEGTPKTDFKAPSSIVFARVDPKTGLIAPAGQKDYIMESFIYGTVPEKFSVTKNTQNSTF